MTDKEPDVNGSDSSSDDGRDIKNLQAEFARKLEKVNEEINAKFEALTQKLDGMTRDETATDTVQIEPNEREELVKISAAPRRYVETMIQPLKEANEKLQKEAQELRKATLTAQWERMEDRIARQEGKKDWKELPEDMQKGIRQEIIARGWTQNPSAAIDAYDIFKARQVNTQNSDPDRLNRIRSNQTEGAGRSNTGSSSRQTVTKEALLELTRMPPSHPDYKKTRETLDKVQKGYVKVEG